MFYAVMFCESGDYTILYHGSENAAPLDQCSVVPTHCIHQLYPSSAAFHACDTVHGTSGSSRLLRRKRTCPLNCTLPLLLSTHVTLYTGLQAHPAYCGGSVRAHSTVPVLGCFPRMRHCTRDFRLIPPTAAEAHVPTQLYPGPSDFTLLHGAAVPSCFLTSCRTATTTTSNSASSGPNPPSDLISSFCEAGARGGGDAEESGLSSGGGGYLRAGRA